MVAIVEKRSPRRNSSCSGKGFPFWKRRNPSQLKELRGAKCTREAVAIKPQRAPKQAVTFMALGIYYFCLTTESGQVARSMILLE